jgi:hypothetical protein
MNFGYIKLVSIEYKGVNHNTPVTSSIEAGSGTQNFNANLVYNKIKHLNIKAWDSTFQGASTTINVTITLGSGGAQANLTIPIIVTDDGSNKHFRKVIRIAKQGFPNDIAVFYLHLESKGRPSGITEFSRVRNEIGLFNMNKSSFGIQRQQALDNILNNLFPTFYSSAMALGNVWNVSFEAYDSMSSYVENSNNLNLLIVQLDQSWSSTTGQNEVNTFNNSFNSLNQSFELLRTDLINNNEYGGHTESDLEWPGIFESNLDEIGDCLCTFYQQFATLNPQTQNLLLQLQLKIDAYYAQMSSFLSGENYGEMEPAPVTTPCDKFKEIKRFLNVYREYYESEVNY